MRLRTEFFNTNSQYRSLTFCEYLTEYSIKPIFQVFYLPSRGDTTLKCGSYGQNIPAKLQQFHSIHPTPKRDYRHSAKEPAELDLNAGNFLSDITVPM